MIDFLLHINILIIMHTGDDIVILIIRKQADIQLSCQREQFRHKLRRQCFLVDYLITAAVRNLSTIKG